jgi:hypothetical protein
MSPMILLAAMVTTPMPSATHCSRDAAQVKGEMVVLRDDGLYCEADAAAKAAFDKAIAAEEAPPVKKPLRKGSLASVAPSTSAEDDVRKWVYSVCMGKAKDAKYCDQKAPGVAQDQMARVRKKCEEMAMDDTQCDAKMRYDLATYH